MLEGFVEGGKYVVEEKLVGGRLLCHDLGAEGNKRIIPIGARVLNKLYHKGAGNEIHTYDGLKMKVYEDSILTCCSDDEGVYFEGLFYKNHDYSVFFQGGIYFFRDVDADGNIVVADNKLGTTKKIPKGVVLSPDVYGSWVYDGRNTRMPERGSEICCTSIRDEMIFVGNFEKVDVDEAYSSLSPNICPKCGIEYSEIEYVPSELRTARHSKGLSSYDVVNKFTKHICYNCGCTILKANRNSDVIYYIADVEEDEG